MNNVSSSLYIPVLIPEVDVADVLNNCCPPSISDLQWYLDRNQYNIQKFAGLIYFRARKPSNAGWAAIVVDSCQNWTWYVWQKVTLEMSKQVWGGSCILNPIYDITFHPAKRRWLQGVEGKHRGVHRDGLAELSAENAHRITILLRVSSATACSSTAAR